MKRKQLARINKSNPDKPTLDLQSKRAFTCDLMDFKDGDRVWITIETYYKTRTLAQNALLHAYLQEICDETGNELEQTKETLKKKFLTTPMLDKNGEIMCNPVTAEVLEYVKDTRHLTTVEMAEFCENIRLWAMDWGIYLVNPNEQSELKFKNLHS